MEMSEIAVRHGRGKKWKNAIAALLCGGLPVVLLVRYGGAAGRWEFWLAGFVLGVIWGDGFEYVYHRWLLHRPRGAMGNGHLRHHAQIGTAEEAEHVALISSPLNIVLLYVINGVPALLVAAWLGLWGIFAGVLLGWTFYLIVTEEIHWRIHMQGWLPPGLRFAREYHMSHHEVPNRRYNIFLPVFDWLLGSAAWD